MHGEKIPFHLYIRDCRATALVTRTINLVPFIWFRLNIFKCIFCSVIKNIYFDNFCHFLGKMDLLTYIFKSLTYIRNYINNSFSTLEAWEIILYSVVTTLLMVYIKMWIDDIRGKNTFFVFFLVYLNGGGDSLP